MHLSFFEAKSVLVAPLLKFLETSLIKFTSSPILSPDMFVLHPPTVGFFAFRVNCNVLWFARSMFTKSVFFPFHRSNAFAFGGLQRLVLTVHI